jgi:hypothetical protein
MAHDSFIFLLVIFIAWIICVVGYAIIWGELFIKGRWYSRNKDKKEYYIGIFLYLIVLFGINLIREIALSNIYS